MGFMGLVGLVVVVMVVGWVQGKEKCLASTREFQQCGRE